MTPRPRRFDHITLFTILSCYGLWLAAGLAWTTPLWPLTIIALPVLAAFHTSLQHETIHGHPTPWPALNEALVSLPLAGIFPYRRYRDLHLKHHHDENLTDPFEDPESFFWPEDQVHRMTDFQRHIFALNNTLIGRLTIGPALTIIGFARTELPRLRSAEPGVRAAWALHAAGLVILGLILTQLFAIPLWAYALFATYPALSLTSLRAYAEHQAAEAVGARTAVVEAHPFWGLLYLNNNLHIVHHANPRTPWHALPRLYAQRRAQFLAANENTVFLGYRDIWRRFAFQQKQPVAHPILHTGPQPGTPPTRRDAPSGI